MTLNQHGVYQLIQRLVGQANVLTIPRVFIDLTGDHITALLLSQILYWSSRTDDPEGWFYKSAKEWQDELAISDYQLARATKKLAEVGLETKLRKVNGAPTQHYRLDESCFLEWISEKLGNGFPNTPETDSPKSGKWISESVGDLYFSETTDKKTTDREGSFERSKTEARISLGDRMTIERYVRDYALELNDQAPLASTVGRLANLYVNSGLTIDTFIDALQEARRRTQQRSGSIRQELRPGPHGETKPKMAYMLATLEDIVTRKAS